MPSNLVRNRNILNKRNSPSSPIASPVNQSVRIHTRIRVFRYVLHVVIPSAVLRFEQRNSSAQQNFYNQQSQAIQPSLRPQQMPAAQFTGSGALNIPNGFTQPTQPGQQYFQQNLRPQSQYLNMTQHRAPPFPLPDQPMQRSQSLPYPSQPQTSHVPQQPGQQSSHLPRHSSGEVAGTYQLFFTGRDDPRCCMLIGEDTKPVYLSFDTQETNSHQLIRTSVRLPFHTSILDRCNN